MSFSKSELCLKLRSRFFHSASLMKHHQGYLLKELLVQANNAEEFEVMMNMGGLFMGADDGCWLLLSCRVPVGVFLNDFVNLHGGDCSMLPAAYPTPCKTSGCSPTTGTESLLRHRKSNTFKTWEPPSTQRSRMVRWNLPACASFPSQRRHKPNLPAVATLDFRTEFALSDTPTADKNGRKW